MNAARFVDMVELVKSPSISRSLRSCAGSTVPFLSHHSRCTADYVGDYCEVQVMSSQVVGHEESSFVLSLLLVLLLIVGLLGLFYVALLFSPSLRRSTEQLLCRAPLPSSAIGVIFGSPRSSSPRNPSKAFPECNFSNPLYNAPNVEPSTNLPSTSHSSNV